MRPTCKIGLESLQRVSHQNTDNAKTNKTEKKLSSLYFMILVFNACVCYFDIFH